MQIVLHHGKNIDLMYGQGNGSGYWNEPVDKRKMVVAIKSLSGAQTVMMEWIKRNGLGGGNLEMDCGNVIVNKRTIAQISYNGRVWVPHTPEEWQDKIELVIQ